MFTRQAKLKGKVFYDPRTRKLFQVRYVRADKLICGAFCNYYSDARRQTDLIQLSQDYLKDCKEVVCLDKMPEVMFDGIGWRSRFSTAR